MEQANLDRIRLEFQVRGAGEPVVFIHGAFIADAFLPLFPEPSLASYQLITYRRRGYGSSSLATGVVSIAEQARDCAALMQHLGLERAHIVGHSLGGSIALQLALDASDAVHSLALLEPALAVGPSGEAYRQSLAAAMQRYREAGASVIVHEMLEARWPGYRSGLEQVLPGAFDQAVADAGAAFEAELPGLIAWSFGEAESRRIAQQVLSVLGGQSEALSPRFAAAHQALLAWLPNVEGYVLPGAAHFLQVQSPHNMAEALAAFFARNSMAAR
jgi:pimeloyl-ACP methyl ester carboxylesterase